MDIFKFTNPTAPTKMEQGQIINGFTSKLWVERYREAGEFSLSAPADSGVRDLLPIGSFISHVNTSEIMIVENHEISDNKGAASDITITGRGFETYLENRIVGANKAFPVSGTMTDYNLGAAFTWNQVVTLIGNHILASALLDDNDAIPFVSLLSTVPGTSTSIARTVKRGPLYNAALALLEIDNLGFKVVRPGPTSPLGGASVDVALVVHKGVDRTATVIFSYDTGEISSADYLWSNRKFKNAALVTGKWVETKVTPAAIEYGRRWMYLTANDIDEQYTTAPTGSTLTAVVNAMQQRANEALLAQLDIALTKAEVSREAVKSIYRTDFDVGDLITVSGDYNEVSTMRVSEYVEFEDENGESGYPTLTME